MASLPDVLTFEQPTESWWLAMDDGIAHGVGSFNGPLVVTPKWATGVILRLTQISGAGGWQELAGASLDNEFLIQTWGVGQSDYAIPGVPAHLIIAPSTEINDALFSLVLTGPGSAQIPLPVTWRPSVQIDTASFVGRTHGLWLRSRVG